MAKAYSYLRFSTLEQAHGDSRRRQTEMTERYAAKHGLILDDELRMKDEGVSAFRAKNVRSGALGNFLRAIDDGLVPNGSFLLVENLDRVSRASPWDAMMIFKSIIDAGVTIVTLQDERIWNREELKDNPFRIIESLLVMTRANQESETKSRRLKAVWVNKRHIAGSKPMTSRMPAWLEMNRTTGTIEVVEDRAVIVCRIFDMTLQGIGQHSIAASLNREGVPCFGRAKLWHRSYIKKIQENSAVMGTLTPHELVHDDNNKRGRKPLEPLLGYYPAVIDEETFQRVQAQRIDVGTPLVRAAEKRGLTNLIAGLARCPACEGSMTRVMKGSKKKGGRPHLVCVRAKLGAGCQYQSVRLDHVEVAITGKRDEIIANAPSGDDDIDCHLVKTRTAIEVLREQIENLVSQLAKRPSPAISARLASYETELARLEDEERNLWARHGATEGPILIRRLEELEEALGADPLDKALANARLRQVLSGITVDYRTGFLGFHWKKGGFSDVVYGWPKEA